MSLRNVDLPAVSATIPHDVRTFLREADRRIRDLSQASRCYGFVPSDYTGAYGVLQALAAANLAPGVRFCEWGSGFGVATCLAAMLDFDAYGVEIEVDLVYAARQLAADFDLPAEFVHNSFIPVGGEACVEAAGALAWLATDAGNAAEELGLDPDDFDVIYAYPWPDEERVIEDLFERYAAVGAILVTYNGGEGFRLQRKVGTRRSRARRVKRR